MKTDNSHGIIQVEFQEINVSILYSNINSLRGTANQVVQTLHSICKFGLAVA